MVLEHSSWRRKLDTHPAANCLINVPALHQNKSSNFLLKTLLTPKASGGHTLTQCLLLSLLCLPKREGVQTLCASFCRNYFLNQSAQPLHVLALQFTLTLRFASSPSNTPAHWCFTRETSASQSYPCSFPIIIFISSLCCARLKGTAVNRKDTGPALLGSSGEGDQAVVSISVIRSVSECHGSLKRVT